MKTVWIALFAIVCLLGCDGETMRKNGIERHLPTDATNAEYLGNGWCYFELDERTYLFFDGHDTNAITEISKKKEEVIE